MKKILGISAFYHDSSASIVVGGKIIAAAQEERFTRNKHTPDFPVQAIQYCLSESGLNLNDLDAVVFYDKPFLKFERLIQTYFSFAPRGLISFLKSIPIWLKEKLFLKRLIYDKLFEVELYDKKNFKLLFTEHHLSHAASAFYPSKFEHSAILTIDGVGEWATTSISIGNKESIKLIEEMEFPHSIGLLYSSFTYFLGFTVNSGEYKLMGLAPYGNPESTEFYINLIKNDLIDIKVDGSVWLNQDYFNYSTGLTMIVEDKWENLFQLKRRKPESELTQEYCDLALSIQLITEEIVIKLAKEAKRITNSENLCLAGGVALNCVANGKLLKENIFKNIFIQPASGDAGGSLGAALAISYLYYNEKRLISDSDQMNGSYLGPEFSDKEIELMNKKVKSVYTYYDNFNDLSYYIAEKIAAGNVIGWFQGKMEFGPRSLGNRSILADARNPEMQKKLNLKIKYREGFRPFAPSVLLEDANQYFDLNIESPYMLFVSTINDNYKIQLPTNYDQLDLWDKLYTTRSKIQSITHLDYSARIQTVDKSINRKFWSLINSFKIITGSSVLVNTSFNVRGEPIVCTPYDAYRCFMSTDMDYLVIGNFVYTKKDQINKENKNWKINFKLD